MPTDTLKFNLGQVVCKVVDDDIQGIIIGIIFRPSGCQYLVSWADEIDERKHYEPELKDRPFEINKT